MYKRCTVVIHMEYIPSVKVESYWVIFVVDLMTRKFVPAPIS